MTFENYINITPIAAQRWYDYVCELAQHLINKGYSASSVGDERFREELGGVGYIYVETPIGRRELELAPWEWE